MKKFPHILIAAAMLLLTCGASHAQGKVLSVEETYDLSRFDGLKYQTDLPDSFFTKEMPRTGEMFHTEFRINMADRAGHVLLYRCLLPEGQQIQNVVSVVLPDGRNRNYLIFYAGERNDWNTVPCCRDAYAFDLSGEFALLREELSEVLRDDPGKELLVRMFSHEPCASEIYRNGELWKSPETAPPDYLGRDWATPEYLADYENNRRNDFALNSGHVRHIPIAVGGSGPQSGVVLGNDGSEPGNLSVFLYDRQGRGSLLMEHPSIPMLRDIPPGSRVAFTVGELLTAMSREEDFEGMLILGSAQSFSGMCSLVREDGRISDIPIIRELSERPHFPHIVQNGKWDTSVTVSNPNNREISLGFAFTDDRGIMVLSTDPWEHTLPAYGSGTYEVADMLDGDFSGSLDVTASKGIAAFALHSDLKSGGKYFSGTAAIPGE